MSWFACYPFAAFERRIWELCHLTTYDAWYVALAERLAVPLVTSDGKFMRASGRGA
jgi:predicted nucleic acid-binding protein